MPAAGGYGRVRYCGIDGEGVVEVDVVFHGEVYVAELFYLIRLKILVDALLLAVGVDAYTLPIRCSKFVDDN